MKKQFEALSKKLIFSVAAVLIVASSWAQQKITGTVTNDTGQPLPGVTIVVKGTTQGMATNANGEYTISDIPKGAILQFSFIGMKTQEKKIGTQTSINVVLTEETIGLDEVVAVGYGTMKKVNLTGSVASIGGEEIQGKNHTNVQSALQGKLPGLTITQLGGQPGNEKMTINIRGISTFSSNSPLIVVDGQFMDNMNSLIGISA